MISIELLQPENAKSVVVTEGALEVTGHILLAGGESMSEAACP